MVNKSITILLIAMMGFTGMIMAQDVRIGSQHAVMKDLKCIVCHECINPTKENPCLKLGRSYFKMTDQKVPLQKLPPDSVIIYKLEEEYGPVKFTHKNHLHMGDTYGDCAECHHHSSLDNPFPPCNECHGHDVVLADLAQVDMKGAYHRKCLGCHVEWSKKTDCEICHHKNGDSKKQPVRSRPAFRIPKKPDDLFYKSRYHEAPYVKFSHDEHSSKVQLACVDCHAKRNCVACHYQDVEHPTLVNKLVRDGVHGTCMYCHDVSSKESCVKCHKNEIESTSLLKDGYSTRKSNKRRSDD